MPPDWLQISVRADPAALDSIANFLIERGSPGVVVKKREVQGYFADGGRAPGLRGDIERFLRAIEAFYPEAAEANVRWRMLKDRNWNQAWRRFFTPQKIGKSFLVCPPWLAPPALQRRRLITIEPGLAFGTGTHATTRGCLELIERAVRSFRGKAFTALDVGTGSGILAIALAKSGASGVWAIDHDPVALKVAEENLIANRVEKKIQLSGRRLDRIRRVFPLVVANLTAETLIELAQALDKKVSPGGSLVLSGILRHKQSAVVLRFAASGFKVLHCKREKEWVTLLLRRR